MTLDPKGYHTVTIIGDDGGREMEDAGPSLQHAISLRRLYRAAGVSTGGGLIGDEYKWVEDEGVFRLVNSSLQGVSYESYVAHLDGLRRHVLSNGHCRSASRSRLDILERKFDMYMILNQDLEEREMVAGRAGHPRRHLDVLRLNTSVDPKTLVDLIRQQYVVDSMENPPGEVHRLCGQMGHTSAATITPDSLGIRPSTARHRHVRKFDVFSAENGPRERRDLLRLFLKHQNSANGRFFGTVARTVLRRMEEGSIVGEFKIPVMGTSETEWSGLAQWMAREQLLGTTHRYVVTLPRLSEVYAVHSAKLSPAREHVRRLFGPLWEATADPEKHPQMAAFLSSLVGFSISSDEPAGVPELPDDLGAAQVPDATYSYMVWSNLQTLNEFRHERGLAPLTLTISCTEPGNSDHLLTAFLLADSVTNAAHLTRHPAMQYLFYLTKIGVTMSPIADTMNTGGSTTNGNGKVRHPCSTFFRQGLRVRLATEDPLHYHHSPSPLLEEHSNALCTLHFTPVDISEVSRNAMEISRIAFGDEDHGVPWFRVAFRDRTFQEEHDVLAASCVRVTNATGGIRATPQLPHTRRALESFMTRHRETEEYIRIGRLDIDGPEEEPGSGLSFAAETMRVLLERRIEYLCGIPKWRRLASALPQSAPCVLEPDLTTFETTGVYAPKGFKYPSLSRFVADYNELCRAVLHPDTQLLATRRLRMLENKFGVYSSLRRLEETGYDAVGRATSIHDHRDFYQTVKVDTHVHMAAGMTASELLQFIRGKVQFQGDDVVRVECTPTGNKVVTLQEQMERLGVDAKNLTVDSLGVQADASIFERFDNFNSKYSPMGKNDLRTLFLKSDTSSDTGKDELEGRYFAELIKKTFRRLDKNEFAEFRISIYGRSAGEWHKLALWFTTHGMSSVKNRWVIQVPRLYAILKEKGFVTSFADMLHNIFHPLWEASIHPGKYPRLDHFLKHTSGFDSVDSEQGADQTIDDVPPAMWNGKDNPPYAYWMYFMGANIRALNAFRADRGLSTFDFRPHCGECGDPRHLAAAFLMADGISHGIELRHVPVLQYLYYLSQLPLAVSPLSNNSLFLELERNPFHSFFSRGLFVSLSTDDPLFFHQTQEPLVEEYSVASKLWKLSSTDLCEIARNSVRMSGFPHQVKADWLGRLTFLDSSVSNTPSKSHVPDIRVAYRFEIYHDEIHFLERVRKTRQNPNPAPVRSFLFTLDEEDEILARMGLSRNALVSKL